jgi:outer membrane lipoprotein-sorting protein
MKNQERDHLEQNIESLLAGTEPVIPMPEQVRKAILARLIGSPQTEITCIAVPTSEKRSLASAGTTVYRLWKRRAWWPAAAAAVLVVALGGLWYSGWHDDLPVAVTLDLSDEVRTMTGRLHEIVTKNGEQVVRHIRFYFQDPGLSRTELQTEGGSEEIIIARREPGLIRQLWLFPEERRAELSTHRLRGLADDLRPNVVAELWQRSVGITAKTEYRLGAEELDGIPTLTYEAPGDELLTWSDPPVDVGTVKLWVRQDTGRPIAYRVKSQEMADTFTDITASQLEWNLPLADKLFDLSVPADWQLKQVRREVFEPEAAKLASQVTLSIGPESSQPLVREYDFATVTRIERIEDLDHGGPATTTLTLELQPEAAARLASYTAEHPNELLLADLNGEIRAVPKLEIPAVTLDLSRLNRSLTELESRYLSLYGALGQTTESEPIETPESSPTILLEFRAVSDELIPGWHRQTLDGKTLYLSPQVALANADVARAWYDPADHEHRIGLAMTEPGAIKLAKLSRQRIGQRIAIMLDGDIVTAPIIQGVISERALIHGDFTEEEARALAAGITGRPESAADASAALRYHSRSKRTMSDMQEIGRALAAYAHDMGTYPSGGLAEVARQLEPNYIRETPLRDAWGNLFSFQSDGISYSLGSYGSDGQQGVPGRGVTSDLTADIIFENGDFVQWHATDS